MNHFAIKLIWIGSVAAFAGIFLLTVDIAQPGFVWRGIVILLLGLALICLGGRSLFDERVGSRNVSTDNARFPHSATRVEIPRVDRSDGCYGRRFVATLGVVAMSMVIFGIALQLHLDSEEKKREQRAAAQSLLGRHLLSHFPKRDAELFLMAVSRVPADEQELILRGRRHLENQDFEAAIAELASLRQPPRFAAYLFYRGCARQRSDQNEAAIADLSAFIELQSKTDLYDMYGQSARYHRACAYAALEKYENAIQDISAAITTGPPAAQLHQLRAKLHEQLGELQAAQVDRRRAQELDPFCLDGKLTISDTGL